MENTEWSALRADVAAVLAKRGITFPDWLLTMTTNEVAHEIDQWREEQS